MEQNYLLTYDIFIKEIDRVILSCSWFEHEEIMEAFIKNSPDITVIDKIKILQCVDL